MNTYPSSSYDAVRALLEQDNAPPALIKQFEHAYASFTQGQTGAISEKDIAPVEKLPTLADMQSYQEAGDEALPESVMIKLNGGLGTGMGLERAKSLLPVKDGLTFLDIIARQVLQLRAARNAHIPILFMNSFSTREDTLTALSHYPELAAGQVELPLDFIQNRVPKIDAETGLPAQDTERPGLTWCPPGHGDLYVCLQASGLLDELLNRDIQYAFVSNADNLGAVLDTAILGYMAQERVPFIMEATRRTAADRKGGHLALSTNGNLLLRESAQCPPNETEAFQDISRHRYFNTNNLWIHLPSLKATLDAHDGILPLAVMVNKKTLDPRNADSTPVVQLETAMGAAIAVIPGAQAMDTPRTRFAPVKTTDDLLALRSDCFVLNEHFHVVPNPARTPPPVDVRLDPDFFKLIDQFDARFPKGLPSLVNCASLHVQGDVTFGADVKCEGDVVVETGKDIRAQVPDGAKLSGSLYLSGS